MWILLWEALFGLANEWVFEKHVFAEKPTKGAGHELELIVLEDF